MSTHLLSLDMRACPHYFCGKEGCIFSRGNMRVCDDSVLERCCTRAHTHTDGQTLSSLQPKRSYVSSSFHLEICIHADISCLSWKNLARAGGCICLLEHKPFTPKQTSISLIESVGVFIHRCSIQSLAEVTWVKSVPPSQKEPRFESYSTFLNDDQFFINFHFNLKSGLSNNSPKYPRPNCGFPFHSKTYGTVSSEAAI